MDVNEVQDNLIMTKTFQAHYANTACGRKVEYKVGDGENIGKRVKNEWWSFFLNGMALTRW